MRGDNAVGAARKACENVKVCVLADSNGSLNARVVPAVLFQFFQTLFKVVGGVAVGHKYHNRRKGQRRAAHILVSRELCGQLGERASEVGDVLRVDSLPLKLLRRNRLVVHPRASARELKHGYPDIRVCAADIAYFGDKLLHNRVYGADFAAAHTSRAVDEEEQNH